MHSHSHNSNQKHNHESGHEHSHGHSHDHAELDFKNINTSFLIAVFANLAFTIVEAFYGFTTNSVSLLGDAGHNLSDVLGLLLAWGAAYLATKKANNMYSYGYRRSTILAAIINAVVLIFASGFIAYESIEKFFLQSEIQTLPVMIVATIGIFVNAGSALLFMKGSKSDLNLKGAYLHLAYDAAISLGVVIAAIAIHFSGWLWIDSLAGLLIVFIILGGTWSLLKDSINLILDAVPEGVDQDSVRAYLEEIPGVTEVHDLHIWAMSTNENCMTAHLVMPENTLWDSEESYTNIGDNLRDNYNVHHVTLQVEKEMDCAHANCN
ncbi:MAG: cobalt-zinc-cadmium efflux system protein [Flavobacterium sp.]|jgi:cobalt-zinc-cadmium efflux system protein